MIYRKRTEGGTSLMSDIWYGPNVMRYLSSETTWDDPGRDWEQHIRNHVHVPLFELAFGASFLQYIERPTE